MRQKLTLGQQRMVELIESTRLSGRIFRATFIKRSTGETRTIQARLGVKKGVKGIGMRYDARGKGLITVFEMPKGQFRSISIEGLESVTVDKVRAVATK